jgi:ribosomal protein S19E (S16A)
MPVYSCAYSQAGHEPLHDRNVVKAAHSEEQQPLDPGWWWFYEF